MIDEPMYSLAADCKTNEKDEVVLTIYGDNGVPDLIVCDNREYREERTCKNLYKQPYKGKRSPIDDGVCFVCSECDSCVRDSEGYHSGLYPLFHDGKYHDNIPFSFCPNCGARVMHDD